MNSKRGTASTPRYFCLRWANVEAISRLSWFCNHFLDGTWVEMRIVYVLTSLGMGGAERQALAQAERMAERGHSVAHAGVAVSS